MPPTPRGVRHCQNAEKLWSNSSGTTLCGVFDTGSWLAKQNVVNHMVISIAMRPDRCAKYGVVGNVLFGTEAANRGTYCALRDPILRPGTPFRPIFPIVDFSINGGSGQPMAREYSFATRTSSVVESCSFFRKVLL